MMMVNEPQPSIHRFACSDATAFALTARVPDGNVIGVRAKESLRSQIFATCHLLVFLQK
jgi:hypothetical protein